jgi:hypothetical protein
MIHLIDVAVGVTCEQVTPQIRGIEIAVDWPLEDPDTSPLLT